MQISCSNYLDKAMNPALARKTVAAALMTIKWIQTKDRIDAIAVRGNSGCAIAYPVSYETGIPVVYLRKDTESSHGSAVEGHCTLGNYLIIDDFIATGHTVRVIMENLEPLNSTANCVGILLYGSDEPNLDNNIFGFRDSYRKIYYAGHCR